MLLLAGQPPQIGQWSEFATLSSSQQGLMEIMDGLQQLFYGKCLKQIPNICGEYYLNDV